MKIADQHGFHLLFLRMTDKVSVSVVSYLNSKPFLYGLEHSDLLQKMDLQLDIPSVCAQKLIDDQVDIGLIPVAVLPRLKQHYIISDYCIGATGNVSSVMLYSDVPLASIKRILLDDQSRTSVTLVRILAKEFWKITPEWVPAGQNFENEIGGGTAAVIIGDRTFGLEKKYGFAYDLSGEWHQFTNLPFVFACWVANKKLDAAFLVAFNQALTFGIRHRKQLIEELKLKANYKTDIETYLTKSISYEYDMAKKRALTLFLEYMGKLKQ